MKKVLIKEIFSSIQGEGTHVGEKHLFIRFCGCNLKCAFCDTDFDPKNAKEYTADEILKTAKDSEIIALTGGEPLLHLDFLLEFLPLAKKAEHKIYLETNGTLLNELKEIVNFVDTVAMDIKIKSATKQPTRYKENAEFLKTAQEGCKDVFVKVVFDGNIKDDEIKEITNFLPTETMLILQPKMPLNDGFNYSNIFEKFYKLHKKTRLIPQCHKFLNLQ